MYKYSIKGGWEDIEDFLANEAATDFGDELTAAGYERNFYHGRGPVSFSGFGSGSGIGGIDASASISVLKGPKRRPSGPRTTSLPFLSRHIS